GTPPTKPEQISVPPLIETSNTSSPICSYTHLKPSIFNGAHVENTISILDKSYSSFSESPCFIQFKINGALVPNDVIFASSTSSHNTIIEGYVELPSYKTMVELVNNPPINKYHIIQPVEVNQ